MGGKELREFVEERERAEERERKGKIRKFLCSCLGKFLEWGCGMRTHSTELHCYIIRLLNHENNVLLHLHL